jgi:hypothetical protein
MMLNRVNPPLPKHTLAEAEQAWLEVNGNILGFLETVPLDRWHQLSFEELMSTTEQTLQSVTDFLGIPYEPAMSTPYDGDRLLHGIGCVNLPKRQRVEPELAEKWKAIHLERPLLSKTVDLAKELGYKGLL